jgi:coproporphyrinogen III oxidase-like Fe-S oxidoreductase
VERVTAGELPIYRALSMTPEEKLVRELILQFKLGRVRRGYFLQKFGVDIAEKFAVPLEKLREAGHIVMDEDHVLLNRDALLMVDELLQGFFLPQHRGARYT